MFIFNPVFFDQSIKDLNLLIKTLKIEIFILKCGKKPKNPWYENISN